MRRPNSPVDRDALAAKAIMNLPFSEDAQRRIDGTSGLYRDVPVDQRVLTETNITPEELSEFLGENYKLSVLGEAHYSQPVLDTQAAIAKTILEKTSEPQFFVESPPSSQNALNSGAKIRNNWGTDSGSINYAVDNKIPINAVDVEHFNEPSSTYLFTKLAGNEYFAAAKLAKDYLENKGINTGDDFKSPTRGSVHSLMIKYGRDLPKFHQENLLSTAADLAPKTYPAGAENFLKPIDQEIENLNLEIGVHAAMKERLRVSDATMAKNISSKMNEMGPDANAVFQVGRAHNEGVIKNLNAQGVEDVANVKIVPVRDKSLNNRVLLGNDGSYVVTVLDTKNDALYTGDFEKEYPTINRLPGSANVSPEPQKPIPTTENYVELDQGRARIREAEKLAENANKDTKADLGEVSAKAEAPSSEFVGGGIGEVDAGIQMPEVKDSLSGVGSDLGGEATDFGKFDSQIADLNFGGMKDAASAFDGGEKFEGATASIGDMTSSIGEAVSPTDLASSVGDSLGSTVGLT